MHRHHRCRRRVLAAARRRAARYDGETAACGSCGSVYYKRDGHSC